MLAYGSKTQEDLRRSAVNARKHGLTQSVQVSEFGRHLSALEALLLRDGYDPSQSSRSWLLGIFGYECNVQHLQAQFQRSAHHGLQLHEPTQVGEADFASTKDEVHCFASHHASFTPRPQRAQRHGCAANRLAKHKIRQEVRAQLGTTGVRPTNYSSACAVSFRDGGAAKFT